MEVKLNIYSSKLSLIFEELSFCFVIYYVLLSIKGKNSSGAETPHMIWVYQGMGKGRYGTVPPFCIPVPLVPRNNHARSWGFAGRDRDPDIVPGQPPIPGCIG